MQFDVYPNPIARARRAFPLVIVLQSNLAETGHDRVVAFLAPKTAMQATTGRLTPIVDVEGRAFVVLIHLLTNLQATDLKNATANLGANRERIVEALDWLFLGV